MRTSNTKDVPTTDAPPRHALSEMWWTLCAVLLSLGTGGAILVVASWSGNAWWLDDFQSQWMPGYIEVNRALREGSFPLLSPTSWYGGDLAGEYQYGVFSVAHLLIILFVFQLHLSLTGTAAALIMIYAAILAGGVFRLARRLGLGVPGSMIACLAATLNGFIGYWGAQTWFPAFSSFVWLPWVWWGMEFALDSRFGSWRFLPGGLFLYLLIAAGWPFSVLMTGTVIVWLVARNLSLFRNGAIWPILAAGVLGSALGSPAILSLLEYHSFTNRVTAWSSVSLQLMTPITAFGGMFVPPIPARWETLHPHLETYIGPGNFRHSTETFCGLVPCTLLFAMLFRRRMDFVWKHRWELGLLAFTAIMCHCGALGAFRWSFRWLPLFHLCVGVIGGFALEEWAAGSKPVCSTQPKNRMWFAQPTPCLCVFSGMVAIAVCVESSYHWRTLCAFAVASALGLIFYGMHRRFERIRFLNERAAKYPGFWASLFIGGELAFLLLGLPMLVTTHLVVIGTLLLGIALAWWTLDALLPGKPQWLSVAVMACCLVVGNFRPGHSVPQWQISDTICETGPLDKNRTYYALMTWDDVFRKKEHAGEINRFGNATMYAGLSFVNGYSPMEPARMKELFAFTSLGNSMKVGKSSLRNYLDSGGLLSQMGVDGFVLGTSLAQYANIVVESGWQLVERFPHGLVFHRPGLPTERVRSLPMTLSANAAGPMRTQSPWAIAAIQSVKESRLAVSCHVANADREREAIIAFSRAYYPGYRAYLDGFEIPVEPIDGFQLGVRIEPEMSGDLEVVFWPKSVVYGLAIAAMALAMAVAPVAAAVVMRFRG